MNTALTGTHFFRARKPTREKMFQNRVLIFCLSRQTKEAYFPVLPFLLMNIFYFFYSQFICDLRDKKSYFKHTAEILIPWVFTSKGGEGMGGGKYPVGICHSNIKEVREAPSKC